MITPVNPPENDAPGPSKLERAVKYLGLAESLASMGSKFMPSGGSTMSGGSPVTSSDPAWMQRYQGFLRR